MKTTRNVSSGAREHIIKRKRKTLAITEDNTVKTTGNGETNIGEAFLPRTRNGSGRVREQRQRKTGQNVVRFGTWDQESESQEKGVCSLDPM